MLFNKHTLPAYSRRPIDHQLLLKKAAGIITRLMKQEEMTFAVYLGNRYIKNAGENIATQRKYLDVVKQGCIRTSATDSYMLRSAEKWQFLDCFFCGHPAINRGERKNPEVIAKLIRNDIKSVETSNTAYPTIAILVKRLHRRCIALTSFQRH